MKKLVRYSIVIVVAGTMLPDSNAQQPARRRAGEPAPTQGNADLYITPYPKQVPTTLKEMVDMSVRIILGNVKTVLPARETSPQALETDAVIDIISTLKGTPTSAPVLISQRGGARNGLIVKPKQYSIVQPGEQYILFLVDDRRINMSDVTGMPRYLVTGIWSGLLLFEAGKMRVIAPQPDALRSAYQGMTREQVISEVKALVKP